MREEKSPGGADSVKLIFSSSYEESYDHVWSFNLYSLGNGEIIENF